MSLTAGIVGLPNVGKSTLFNAITKQNILAANYPFATINPNIGTVIVPDARIDYLYNLYMPASLVPTSFEFIDIAGLVKGASLGEGLGNKFLAHIREVDAICEVVRCFEDDNITHVDGSVNPIRDIETIEIELMLSDLEIIDNRLNRIGKKATMSKDKDTLIEVELLNKIRNALTENIPMRDLDLTIEDKKLIKSYNFLSLKPVIYIANVSEVDLVTNNEKHLMALKDYAQAKNIDVIVLCAKIESELSELDYTDKNKFLAEIGLPESGLDLLIKTTYKILGLETFFTVGTDEVKAWTYKIGMKAPECAGLIHNDIMRGFIRAEIMSYDDLKEYGSEKAVKEAGKLRIEGKDYIMQDGDLVYFRFNV